MKLIFLFFAILFTHHLFAQHFFHATQNRIVLDNGSIKREISLGGDSVYSFSVLLKGKSDDFISRSNEFSFLLNSKMYTGFDKWKVLGIEAISDSATGDGVNITMRPAGGDTSFEIAISYMLYPQLPLIRKWISFTNKGAGDLVLQSLTTENLNVNLDYVSSVVYNNYARMKHIGQFVGNWDDPVVVVHNIPDRRGMALGNEAMAVLKRTAYHTTHNNVEIGLTRPGQHFPFKKYLKVGERWEAPATFICVYADRDDGFDVVDNEVNRFSVSFEHTRIASLRSKPLFVYNTWNPFRTEINDTLIRQTAKAAAECGIAEFVIDDGWQINDGGKSGQKNYGDWLVDTIKFPGGLRPVFDYIKSLGMRPGLWISIGSATGDSKVFREHPDWFAQNKNGHPANLHYQSSEYDGFYTASFGTDWQQYIKATIARLVKDYGLGYAKLDLSIVTSPYINDDSVSGSYASGHLYHDHEESFTVMYERALELFDQLHREAPDLFIDCTFETAGKLQLMDYAIAKHAEGNWLSNFEEPSPVGPLRVRQMAWWRSPALPAASLVIGNLPFDDKDFIFCLKSLVGTLPIVLGDPRLVPPAKRKEIRQWSAWMQRMQDKYDYMDFRRDLAGFGQPKEGAWDGWQRINFKSRHGGIFGVFRQGALETQRRVFLKDLDPSKMYSVRQAPAGLLLKKLSGASLMNEGFPVSLSKKYDGAIYEVSEE